MPSIALAVWQNSRDNVITHKGATAVVGRKLLHYEILEKLGEGGMGVV